MKKCKKSTFAMGLTAGIINAVYGVITLFVCLEMAMYSPAYEFAAIGIVAFLTLAVVGFNLAGGCICRNRRIAGGIMMLVTAGLLLLFSFALLTDTDLETATLIVVFYMPVQLLSIFAGIFALVSPDPSSQPDLSSSQPFGQPPHGQPYGQPYAYPPQMQDTAQYYYGNLPPYAQKDNQPYVQPSFTQNTAPQNSNPPEYGQQGNQPYEQPPYTREQNDSQPQYDKQYGQPYERPTYAKELNDIPPQYGQQNVPTFERPPYAQASGPHYENPPQYDLHEKADKE